jgi:hypothetical protein
VIVIQGEFDVAVQGQVARVITLKVWPVAPVASTLALDGLRVVFTEQFSAWFTVKVWPAAVRVPVRAGPEFAATLYVTIPVPVPDVPEEIVIQDAFEVAIHEQPAAACTRKVCSETPVASTLALAGERVVLAAQPSAWLTVKIWPPAERVPVRAGPGFAATE